MTSLTVIGLLLAGLLLLAIGLALMASFDPYDYPTPWGVDDDPWGDGSGEEDYPRGGAA